MNSAVPDCTSCRYYKADGRKPRASGLGTCLRILHVDDAGSDAPAWLMGQSSDRALTLRVTNNFHCSEHTRRDGLDRRGDPSS